MEPRLSRAASAADRATKRAVLRMLRTLCANLRDLQRDPAIVQAYREVEAVLRSAEQCLPGAGAPRASRRAGDPDRQP